MLSCTQLIWAKLDGIEGGIGLRTTLKLRQLHPLQSPSFGQAFHDTWANGGKLGYFGRHSGHSVCHEREHTFSRGSGSRRRNSAEGQRMTRIFRFERVFYTQRLS